ncbi:MAG: hypothetical protein JWM43_2062 [Acidobacteriaceae bacterium]|nr:hypothetical protein [Acidobacteriaceae bacterium]
MFPAIAVIDGVSDVGDGPSVAEDGQVLARFWRGDEGSGLRFLFGRVGLRA